MTSTDTRTRPGTPKTKTKTTARQGKTPEERAAEVDALAEQLTAAVTELTTSAAWVAMLRVAARFTRYSSTNALVLWMQAEQRGVALTRVAGYRAWQAMGRQVVKGARSFALMAPVRRRLTPAAPRPASTPPTTGTVGRRWWCADSSWSGCSATKTPTATRCPSCRRWVRHR